MAAHTSTSFARWCGALVVTAGCLGYILLWWNRYLSPTVGGEFVLAGDFAQGCLPYRDYYLFTQPGMILLWRGVTALFGPHLIFVWFFGLIVRVLTMTVLYCWLLKISRPASAAFAVLATFVISSANVADTPIHYNLIDKAFSVCAAFFAAQMLDTSARRSYLWGLLSGSALFLGFLTKQTTAVLAGFFVVGWIFAAVTKTFGLRRALVRHPGYKTLVTQLYFRGDPHNKTDAFIRESLIIDLRRQQAAAETYEIGSFDVVPPQNRRAGSPS